MPRRAGTGNNGKLQATILKKCDRAYHRPASNKQCAGGTCQHTCEPSQISRCRHAWTVRYTVNSVQRDKSFRDEIDAAKRVQWGTGLKKAQDFQLELTRGKRAQGKTYVDPRAGNELFGPAAEVFIASSALDAGTDTRAGYMSCYRTNIRQRFARRTLAQMATQAAADEVTEMLNVTMAGKSIGQRRTARMIITGTMDAAVKQASALEPGMSALQRSRVHAELSVVYGQLSREKEAVRATGLAEQLYPDDPEADPSFLYAEFTPASLSLESGLAYAALAGQYPGRGYERKAAGIFARVENMTSAVPDRIRFEVVNHQARTAVLMGDLDAFERYMNRGIEGVVLLGSGQRRREMHAALRLALNLWPRERRMKALSDGAQRVMGTGARGTS